MKKLIINLLLVCCVLTVVSAAEESAKEYTMAGGLASDVVKLYDGRLDSEQRRKEKPHVFEKRETFFEFIRSIPPESTTYWTTYCNSGSRIGIGKDTILKKDLVERLKKREVVLRHRIEFF